MRLVANASHSTAELAVAALADLAATSGALRDQITLVRRHCFTDPPLPCAVCTHLHRLTAGSTMQPMNMTCDMHSTQCVTTHIVVMQCLHAPQLQYAIVSFYLSPQANGIPELLKLLDDRRSLALMQQTLRALVSRALVPPYESNGARPFT